MGNPLKHSRRWPLPKGSVSVMRCFCCYFIVIVYIAFTKVTVIVVDSIVHIRNWADLSRKRNEKFQYGLNTNTAVHIHHERIGHIHHGTSVNEQEQWLQLSLQHRAGQQVSYSQLQASSYSSPYSTPYSSYSQ